MQYISLCYILLRVYIVEFATVTRVDDQVVYHVFDKSELTALLKRAENMLKEEANKESAGADI